MGTERASSPARHDFLLLTRFLCSTFSPTPRLSRAALCRLVVRRWAPSLTPPLPPGSVSLSFGPYSALYFAFYEHFKSSYASSSGAGLNLPTVLSASAAGGLAAWMTSPLDLAKLRMQVAKSTKSANVGYGTFPQALATVYREGGLSGMWKGGGQGLRSSRPPRGCR